MVQTIRLSALSKYPFVLDADSFNFQSFTSPQAFRSRFLDRNNATAQQVADFKRKSKRDSFLRLKQQKHCAIIFPNGPFPRQATRRLCCAKRWTRER